VVATTIVLECLNASSALLEERRRSWNARTNVTTAQKVGINTKKVRPHVWIVFRGTIKAKKNKMHALNVKLVKHQTWKPEIERVATAPKVGIKTKKVRQHVWIVFRGNTKPKKNKMHALNVKLVKHQSW
jgi:hypothetical protein